MAVLLELLDDGEPVAFGFDDLMRYHGSHSPGGVAHAFKVLERVLPLLGERVERRAVAVRTAFRGPGARDGFELVTRAVTEGRYAVDPGLARPELGRAREDFVFCVEARGRAVTAVLREGFVSDEFIGLVRTRERSSEQEHRLAELKRAMAARLMSAPAAEVYAVVDEG